MARRNETLRYTSTKTEEAELRPESSHIDILSSLDIYTDRGPAAQEDRQDARPKDFQGSATDGLRNLAWNIGAVVVRGSRIRTHSNPRSDKNLNGKPRIK